jgi:membrane-bound lytic murein transglycosylase B
VFARLAVALVLATLSGLVPSIAGAQDPPAEPTPIVGDPRISAELATVAVDSAAYRQALDRYRGAEARLAAARNSFEENQMSLGELHEAEARVIGEVNEASRVRAKSQERVAELGLSVRELAVASYVDGGIGSPLAGTLDLESIAERRRQRVLIDAVSRDQLGEFRSQVTAMQRADQVAVDGLRAIDEIRRRLAETAAARDRALRDAEAGVADLLRRSSELADARLTSPVVGLDFTLVVLDAYVRAANVMAFEAPRCGVRWQALAAIGRTESGHGTFGGAVVLPSGAVSRPIIGIPLDGTNGVEDMGDTDGGALDSDPLVDRAVGPMQFIPTSWRAFGRDGNNDGVRDPQNIYDAALAAGVLLCRSAPLDSDARLRASFLRYNNSRVYADQVLERTLAYDGFVLPPAAPG